MLSRMNWPSKRMACKRRHEVYSDRQEVLTRHVIVLRSAPSLYLILRDSGGNMSLNETGRCQGWFNLDKPSFVQKFRSWPPPVCTEKSIQTLDDDNALLKYDDSSRGRILDRMVEAWRVYRIRAAQGSRPQFLHKRTVSGRIERPFRTSPIDCFLRIMAREAFELFSCVVPSV